MTVEMLSSINGTVKCFQATVALCSDFYVNITFMMKETFTLSKAYIPSSLELKSKLLIVEISKL